MPEGPELRMNSIFVNTVCRELLFGGRPIKSSVSKCPDVDWESPKYTVTSECRGKEVALLLHCQKEKSKSLRILFRFGMSGKFTLTGADDIPKHSHLQFWTPSDSQKQEKVLSFVDVRRFGSWHVTDGWGEERGPDIVEEYEQFRANVLGNLKDSAFNKAVCETMLNQKFFNGIGNYLRAEVLFRAKIPPFTCARTVLEPLAGEKAEKAAGATGDVLSLCRDISQEVIQLKTSLGKAEKMTTSVSKEDHAAFLDWLQCYNNPDMNIMKDKSGRSMWFHGPPGPMAPKGGKLKAVKRKHVPDNPNPTTSSATTESDGQKPVCEENLPKKPKVKEEGDDVTCQPAKEPRSKMESSPELKQRQQKGKTAKPRAKGKPTGSAGGGKAPIKTETTEEMPGSAGSKRAQASKTEISRGIKRKRSQSPLVTTRRSARLRDRNDKPTSAATS